MNRSDFQYLAVERLDDAKVLLDESRYSGAYYLSGYVVECALKACIAKLTKRHDFPDRQAVRAYTHDLSQLFTIAGLETKRDAGFRRDRDFRLNWLVVKEWKEQSRYELPGKQQAENLYDAVADPEHGVLRWIKQRW